MRAATWPRLGTASFIAHSPGLSVHERTGIPALRAEAIDPIRPTPCALCDSAGVKDGARIDAMDTNTLIIIVLVVLVLGGGGFFFRGRR